VLVVEIVVVIVIVPITISVPAVPIFIPPAVVVFIAVGAGFPEFVPPVFGLRAFDAVVLDGFMKFVVCLGDALLTIVVRADNRRGDEKESRE
jgi:hypothetical protein